jgi:hypothetical protein
MASAEIEHERECERMKHVTPGRYLPSSETTTTMRRSYPAVVGASTTLSLMQLRRSSRKLRSTYSHVLLIALSHPYHAAPPLRPTMVHGWNVSNNSSNVWRVCRTKKGRVRLLAWRNSVIRNAPPFSHRHVCACRGLRAETARSVGYVSQNVGARAENLS